MFMEMKLIIDKTNGDIIGEVKLTTFSSGLFVYFYHKKACEIFTNMDAFTKKYPHYMIEN